MDKIIKKYAQTIENYAVIWYNYINIVYRLNYNPTERR